MKEVLFPRDPIYLNAHALLNLLSELEQAFYLFCKEFNKFNTTEALILDYIDRLALKLIKDCIFDVKVSILRPFMQRYNGRH